VKIKGTMNADVVGFSIKRNQAHDGREAFAYLEIRLDLETAEKKIGEDFVALGFSTMRVVEGDGDEGDSVRHLVDRIKPGRHTILERHRIHIDDTEIEAQPELLAVIPVNGEAKVDARIRIPIDVSKASVINFLTKMVGETLKVKFNPQQGTLDFEKNGNGDHEPDGEETEHGVEATAQ